MSKKLGGAQKYWKAVARMPPPATVLSIRGMIALMSTKLWILVSCALRLLLFSNCMFAIGRIIRLNSGNVCNQSCPNSAIQNIDVF